MRCCMRTLAFLLVGIATAFSIALWTSPAPAADDKPAPAPVAQTQSPSPADQKALDDAIDALSSADPAERDNATKKLWVAGQSAELMLKAALEKGELDPEQARRARELLRNFELGLYPDTSPAVLELVEEYRRGSPQARRMAAQQLAQQGASGVNLAVRLFWAERDGALRAVLRQTLARQLRRHAATLLAKGDYDAAESLLRAVASSPEASDESLRDLAAFLATRGTLAREIQRLNSAAPADAAAPVQQQPALTANTSPPRTLRVLALFYRAAGDLASAVDAARQANDQRLRDALLVERRDWPAVAANTINRGLADIEALGYAAAYSRLAGDDVEAAKWCDKIAAQVAPSRNPQEYEITLAAEALLLNERPDPAIDLLKKNGQFGEAGKYLRVRLQFEEFRQVNAQVERDGTQSQAVLATAEGAAVAVLLGEPDAARAALSGVSKLLSDTANPAFLPGRRRPDAMVGGRDDALVASAAIVQAAARLGDVKLLDQYTVAALERTEPANLRATATIFAAAADAPTRRGGGGFGDGQAASRWWAFLRRRYKEPVKISLDRLRSILNNALPDTELDALAKAAEQEAAGLRDGEERSAWLGDVADALLARGRREQVKRFYQRLGFGAGAADLVIRLADLEAEDGHWAAAAEVYGRAWEMDPTQPAPALLRGAALLKLGREREGRELIELAHVLPMADEGRRRAVFLAAEKRKLVDDVKRELELTERTTAAGSWDRSDVLRRAGDAANDQKDYSAAVRLWEQAFIINFDKLVAFVEPAANLTMPALLLRTRALAAIQSGDAAGGVALAKRALAVSPGDTDALIDIVNLLDETGHRSDADELYGSTTGLYRRLAEQYPKSASLHNQFAWAAAKCKRDLPDALTHAKRAVELTPEDAAVIDTLGEAQFQSGDVSAAIETAKRCVELEPKVKHHREQLARFEAALPGGGGLK